MNLGSVDLDPARQLPEDAVAAALTNFYVSFQRRRRISAEINRNNLPKLG
jgi:hypothetical protein